MITWERTYGAHRNIDAVSYKAFATYGAITGS